MLPAAMTPRPHLPHLPVPPIIRRPPEQNFYRYRNYIQDFTPLSPLVSESNAFHPNLPNRTDAESSRNLDNEQENVSQQNNQRCCQLEDNRFQNNQEVKTQLSHPQQQQQRKAEDGILGGTRNFQLNGSTPNTRWSSDPLVPATDVYSFLDRLSELFPDIHPTQLQRVFDDCGRDFLRTIDNVLYARRFRKSIIAHMSKFRSLNRSQAQKNLLNPQQQKKWHSEDQVKNVNQPQTEKLMYNSPKPRRLTRSTSGQQSKRSRILAFTKPTTTTNNNSTKRGDEQISTRQSQSVTSVAGNTPSLQSVKKSTPPPNVFLHPVETSHQLSGNTPINTNFNTRYMISVQRPHTLHYGAPLSAASNLTLPLESVLDNRLFHSTLPMPVVRYPILEESGIVKISSLRSPGSVDQQLEESSQEKQQQKLYQQHQQQQQPTYQQMEHMEQMLPMHEKAQKEQEIQQQEQINTENENVNQLSDLSFAAGQFEIAPQVNEEESWNRLFKNFCETLHPIDTDGNSLVMQFVSTPRNDDNEQSKKSSECGNYLYRQMSQEFPVVIRTEIDQNDQVNVSKDLKTLEGSETVNQEDDENQKEDQLVITEMIQTEESSSELLHSSQIIRKRNLRSLQKFKSETGDMVEGKQLTEQPSDLPVEDIVEVVEQNSPPSQMEFSPADQLFIEVNHWVESKENSPEQANDLANQSDEEYTHNL